jgi:deazaflavin-dependent oxidoreductase (nitroreductase family)
MPTVGILRHRGRRTGRWYATPLGVRPTADGSFVMPLTFGGAAGWYRNVVAADTSVVTYLGADHTVARPEVISAAAAAPAFPSHERLLFRIIGIDRYLRLSVVEDRPADQ